MPISNSTRPPPPPPASQPLPMDVFKIPRTMPQDLLLIHDIIGVSPTPPIAPTKSHNTLAVTDDDCIDSSDSENGSEDEIEADLTAINDEDAPTKMTPVSDSSSDSDSDSSDSDESDADERAPAALDVDDDEESGPAPTSGSYFQTKNEVVETDIVVPDITEVGPEEILEMVGEIMSVMSNTVIINGVPSDDVKRGSDRALDSDTLLVFEDRKVMGYVYETFGPTSRPLYQVKFNKDFPLDLERVQVSRNVFHVPARSNFVFLTTLKKLKGSDASNVHDEEPGENELEFSDDEAEAAYKASIKRKRGESRGLSVAASSRQSTPTPSQMHDQDMEAGHFSRNPYDEHGPYDVDFSAGPSRPPPIPYDDPYDDSYMISAIPPPAPEARRGEEFDPRKHESLSSRGRGRGRGRGQARDRGDMGGRGRGRGRGRGDHSGSSRGHSRPDQRTDGYNAGDNWASRPSPMQDGPPARPLSPTSFAIARATGQLPDSSYAPHGANFTPQSPNTLAAWGYPEAFQSNPMFQFGGGYSPGFVQPHINPRFANAFGMNMGMVPSSQQYAPNSNAAASPRDWTDEWTVPSGQGVPPGDGVTDKSPN